MSRLARQSRRTISLCPNEQASQEEQLHYTWKSRARTTHYGRVISRKWPLFALHGPHVLPFNRGTNNMFRTFGVSWAILHHLDQFLCVIFGEFRNWPEFPAAHPGIKLYWQAKAKKFAGTRGSAPHHVRNIIMFQSHWTTSFNTCQESLLSVHHQQSPCPRTPSTCPDHVPQETSESALQLVLGAAVKAVRLRVRRGARRLRP